MPSASWHWIEKVMQLTAEIHIWCNAPSQDTVPEGRCFPAASTSLQQLHSPSDLSSCHANQNSRPSVELLASSFSPSSPLLKSVRSTGAHLSSARQAACQNRYTRVLRCSNEQPQVPQQPCYFLLDFLCLNSLVSSDRHSFLCILLLESFIVASNHHWI